MQKDGVKPYSVIVVNTFPACARLEISKQGSEIHGYVLRNGFDDYVNVGTSLIDMYAKCGYMENAHKMFDKRSDSNQISWIAMIKRYSQVNRGEEALKLFSLMHKVDVKADKATFASILKACASLAALEQGKQVHGYTIRSGYELNIFIGSALLDMYAKCGSVEDTQIVFDNMLVWDVISWNAIIVGKVVHGFGKEALDLFEKIKSLNMKPNHITFIGVLSACYHAGFVDED